MVRKYKPEVKTEYGFGMYSDDEYHDAVMVEAENGTYVKLETYLNETKRLQAMIQRLKDKNNALEDKLKELS